MYNVTISHLGFYFIICEGLMSERKGKHRKLERGQSLVEYALILVLAAIAVIIVLGLFGERIRDFYCETVLSLAPDVDAPACNQLSVSCSLISVSGNDVYMEANVVDDQGANDVTAVKWYDNGNLVWTENFYHYCLGSGDTSCKPYSASNGSHTFSAVAVDAEGHTGKCTTTVNIP
jgi:Flp pilus assembly pilin Flp